MTGADTIAIEVAYAEPRRQWLLALRVASGTSIGEAIRLSGIAAQVPGLIVDDGHVGVHGQRRTLDTRLADGDRVEIYRPLQADPKSARRQRAARRR
jgi:hypothetical protein